MKFVTLGDKMVNPNKVVWVDFFDFGEPHAVIHMDNGEEIKVYGTKETISLKLEQVSWQV